MLRAIQFANPITLSEGGGKAMNHNYQSAVLIINRSQQIPFVVQIYGGTCPLIAPSHMHRSGKKSLSYITISLQLRT
ncbi:MAG: hypothetical protein WBZ42_04195 [Halobacteriota archaeon]